MATVIRLKRGGRTHDPYYRVVVMDSRNRTRGRVVDDIGLYHPCSRPQPLIQIDVRKAVEWLSHGAQMSDTVRNVFSQKGVLTAFKTGVLPELEPAAVAAPVVETPEVAETVVAEEQTEAQTSNDAGEETSGATTE